MVSFIYKIRIETLYLKITIERRGNKAVEFCDGKQ